MTVESDINREMLLLAGEINDASKKLSRLRERIENLDDAPEYTAQEAIDLTKDLKRVQLEFAQAVKWLSERNKYGNQN